MTTVTQIIITMLIFSGVAIGFTGWYSGLLGTFDKYDDLTESEKGALGSLSVISQVNESITSPLKEKVESAQANPLGTLSFFLDSVVQGVKLFIEVPFILIGTIGNIAILMGIVVPAWVFSIIIAIILVFFLLIIISIIMKKDKV